MGGKGPRPRSLENVSGQSWCCVPNESRTARERRKLAFAPRQLLLGREAFSRKVLAQTPQLSQAPRPMNSLGRSQTRARILVASVLFAAFSWTLLVSISPRLHGCIHDDANRSDHICAITLVASGSYHHAGQPPVINPPQFHACFTAAASLTPTWVKSLFLSAHIFAHAPPALV